MFHEHNNTVTYTDDHAEFFLDAPRGVWNLKFPGAGVDLRGVRWDVDLFDRVLSSAQIDWTFDGTERDGETDIALLSTECDGIRMEYIIEAMPIPCGGSTIPCFTFQLIVDRPEPGDSTDDKGIRSVAPMVVGADGVRGDLFTPETKYYTQFHSMGGGQVRTLEQIEIDWDNIRTVPAQQMAITHGGGQPALVLGFDAPMRFMGAFDIAKHHAPYPGLRAFNQCDVPFHPDYQTDGETLFVFAAPTPHDGLEAYGDLISDGRTYEPVTGWNSWDAYRDTVSHDIVVRNMEAIERRPEVREALKYIVIDMGWSHTLGDWEPNFLFPKGMKHTADVIRQHDFTPGLWYAPIILHAKSVAYLNDMELAAQNAYGFPDLVFNTTSNRGYVVDVAREKGRQFLYDTFRRAREDWGYEFFKLDFLRFEQYAYMHGGERQARVEMMQRALEIVREAVGDDVHILGCNMPSEVGPGLVDSNRITSDIAIYWGHLKNSARSMSLKYWMHGRLWASDPDFAVVRGWETTRGEQPLSVSPWCPPEGFPAWMDFYDRVKDPQGAFSADEATMLMTLIQLSGGNVFASDRMDDLNERGWELIRRGCRPAGVAGRPLDAFDGDGLATRWVQDLDGGQRRIAVFNWTDEEQTFDAPALFGAYGVDTDTTARDFWNDEELSLSPPLVLKPHSCRYLVLG